MMYVTDLVEARASASICDDRRDGLRRRCRSRDCSSVFAAWAATGSVRVVGTGWDCRFAFAVATAHHGTVTAEALDGGGLSAIVHLPARTQP